MTQAGGVKLVISVLLVIAACHRWTPGEGPTPARTLEGKPPRVRVFLNDGTPPVIVLDPFISGDSLIGDKYTGLVDKLVRVAIPMTQIKALDVPRFSPLATVGLLLGLSVAAFVAFVYIVATSLET